MIMLYGKIYNDKNNSFVVEDVKRGTWHFMLQGRTIELPTLNAAIEYRNCRYLNEAIQFLINTFEVPIIDANHHLAMAGYANEKNEAEVADICIRSLEYCPILIEFDTFSSDTDVFKKIKEAFLKMYGDKANSNIFSYKAIQKDSNVIESIKNAIKIANDKKQKH